MVFDIVMSVFIVALIVVSVVLASKIYTLFRYFEVVDERVIELGNRVQKLEKEKQKRTEEKFKTGIDSRSKEMKRKQQVKKGKKNE